MSLVCKSELVVHRTTISTADSGNDPSAWADAPSAMADMASSQVLRVYPVLNSGTLTELGLTVLTVVGDNTHVSAETSITADFTEPVDFREGFEGEAAVYVKISTLTGAAPDVTLNVVGVNVR